MTLALLVLIACVVVFLAALLFVLHRDYHAGFIGTLGLGLIALAAFARAHGIVGQWEEQGLEAVRVTPPGVLLWIGLALFLGRQAYRFLTRSWSCTDWYGPPRRVTPGRFT